MSKKQRLEQTVSFRITAPLRAQLETIAADLGLPVSDVARAALATVALNRTLGAQQAEG